MNPIASTWETAAWRLGEKRFACGIVLAALVLTMAHAASGALTPDQIATLPPANTVRVDFAKQIKPILESACVSCHGRGRNQGGFSLETRAAVLQGGRSGPAVVAGRSAESLLIELVSGMNPQSVMPKKGKKLTAEQIGLLRGWIDQDLPWEPVIAFSRPAPANLTPRKPDLPGPGDASPARNPIDRLLAPYYTQHGIKPSPVVTDRIFLRRLYLDAIGLLPTPQEQEAFESDPQPDKRARWVDRVLANNQRYAEHWLTFWNDALRNDYQGTGYIDGGRKQISPWLFAALATNMPYDRFVAQLANPPAAAEGFVNGIVWRGVVNASQTPAMQAAQNISHVFMGINLKCASCHDSFINDWTLADAYGMAGIYSEGPLEMVRCDKPTGQKAPVKFLYSELGTIDPGLDGPKRRERLAEILTSKPNGRLTRTVVNRLWAKFFGRGLVEPVDEMDKPAWNQDVLDWLASDLADHGFDLKRTMALMFASQAYQLPAVDSPGDKEFVFHGPLVRRMNAEQYLDAVSYLTGEWHALPANHDVDFTIPSSASNNARGLSLAQKSKWIGQKPGREGELDAKALYLRKSFQLDSPSPGAVMVCAASSNFKVHLNGKEIASGSGSSQPVVMDLGPQLKPGTNVFAVQVERKASPAASSANEIPDTAFLFFARIQPESAKQGGSAPPPVELVSDTSWLMSTHAVDNWQQTEYRPEGWDAADALRAFDDSPRPAASALLRAAALAAQYRTVRAALVHNDPLMTALGRPNREQTVTVRADAASTLQALELTNGGTLAELLQRGASRWLAPPATPTRALLERLYRQALGRGPTAPELDLAVEMTGEPVQPEAWEDMLWAMIMLPEFQLIY